MPPVRPLILALPLSLAADPALAAGTLSGSAFGSGYAVPLFVLVHLLGLIALGLWAAEQGGGDAGRGPMVALAAAAIFALLWHLGVRIPYTMLVLKGSLVVLGGLVLVGTALPTVVGIVVAVVVGAAQGIHLGAAVGSGASPLTWLGLASGVMLVSAAGVGLSAMLRAAASQTGVRVVGGILAVLGVLMVLNIV